MARADAKGLILASVSLWRHPLTTMSITGTKKKRGRPATGRGESINFRLQPDQLAALDRWIEGQNEPRPSPPEPIRRLLDEIL